MADNGNPHLQIKHNLSGLYLADWKWLHPNVISFSTLCPVQFCIQWGVAFHRTQWGSCFEKLICPCLGSWFSEKATTVGSPLNFWKLTSQSWGITEPQYFITLSLNYNEHIFENIIYIYIQQKKTPYLVAKILATKFGFLLDWFMWVFFLLLVIVRQLFPTSRKHLRRTPSDLYNESQSL